MGRLHLELDLETEMTGEEFGAILTNFLDGYQIPFRGGITEPTGEYEVSELDESEEELCK